MRIIIELNDFLDHPVVEEQKHDIICELIDVMGGFSVYDVSIYLDDADDEEI